MHTAQKSSSLDTKRSENSPRRRDVDGHQVFNEILLTLPQNEREQVFPKLEFLRMKARHVLHEPGDTFTSAYFCNTGLISILSMFPDGKSVETELIGKEGFVGVPLVAGFRSAVSRAMVQIEVTACRVEVETFAVLLRTCPEFERKIEQVSQIMAMHAVQIGACNYLHEVESRLARWLLMCADRVGPDSLPVTQESLGQITIKAKTSRSTL
jgi:CRP-like cAMP-binding protein